jgi:hypothetical protein
MCHIARDGPEFGGGRAVPLHMQSHSAATATGVTGDPCVALPGILRSPTHTDCSSAR